METSEKLARLVEDFLARNEQVEEPSRDLFHDLRTPAHAILGYSSLLEDGIFGPLEQAQRQIIERIRAAAQQQLDQLNDQIARGGRATE
jgi:signal transduction histidine kinase